MKNPPKESDLEKLASSLINIGQKEGGRMFMGKPDRWYTPPHWRCPNNHVSIFFIKSEYKVNSRCAQCMAPVLLTFPEDIDGPLPKE
jgi:hypothetical protein